MTPFDSLVAVVACYQRFLQRLIGVDAARRRDIVLQKITSPVWNPLLE
jgi:hypothetical protein